MSRLTDLLAQAKAKDPILGHELEREFRALANRRAFGLNFERHRPENVELPGRVVRKGDKVRILPPRGETKQGDQRLWRVLGLEGKKGKRTATLRPLHSKEPGDATAEEENLVVVAEFQDYLYPGLISTGKVERGGDKPYHTVINGENYHVLEALTFTHRGKIDVIYIDPPYNTRDKDWKYNNDYVNRDDLYKHSKWLAFMERRLLLARQLLNPEASFLIVAIDEKEVHRLGLLLEQVFPEAVIDMVTTITSAKGALRQGRFSRVEEHLFFVHVGQAEVQPWFRNMLDPATQDGKESVPVEWLGLRRREPTSVRGARPNQFYPIFVDEETGRIQSIGDAIDDYVDRGTVPVPKGTVALWPLRPDGSEMLWGLTPGILERNWKNGYVRVNNWKKEVGTGTVQYLPGGTIDQIEDGRITITGKAKDGSVQGTRALADKSPPPKRVWHVSSHNAEDGGTKVRSSMIPGRRFDFPKSLYAVEDALRFALAERPDAVVLDFFGGSGTTAHAVMRLNLQDGGRRQCILITNNEASADEEEQMRKNGLRRGDPEWEKWGICEYITKPRISAAITGRTPDGTEIDGDYRYTDEFPMKDGFSENAEFFTLTYETPVAVSHNRAFARIAPLLWMRAGSAGRRIDKVPQQGWEIAESYALLTDLDKASEFADAVEAADAVRLAYVVTDDDRRFQSVIRSLPDDLEAVRLYESYLTNFRFTMGR